jgi:hypothetical protein
MPTRRLLPLCFLVLVVVVTSGCTSRDGEMADRATEEPAVPPRYQPFFDGSIDEGAEKAVLQALPYRSITLQRTGCFGPCPVYTVTLRSDLSATLVAEEFLDPQGTFVGEVDLFDYGRLCYLIERIGFSSFKPRYSASWTDAATETVTVTLTDGRQLAVSDYGGVGPVELWALMEVIDNLRTHIEWTAAEEKPANPRAE